MTRTCLAFACGLLLAMAHHAAAQDLSGSWTGIVTEAASDCQNIRKASPGEYRLTILQKGDELTITEIMARRPYTGYIEPESNGRIQVRATYSDDGGYVTEAVTLEFTSGRSGTGDSVWRWSDGWHQCGGRFHFTLEKSQTP